MEFTLPQWFRLFLCENNGLENCAQLLDEEIVRIFNESSSMMSMIAMLLV